MVFTLKPLSDEDIQGVVDVFNYYVANSFAAYREEPVSREQFLEYVKEGARYPAVTIQREEGVVGFGLLTSHKPLPGFDHSANLICFLLPEATRCGLGRKILGYLESRCVEAGITNIFSSISSKNLASMAFHEKNGFTECGRFRRAGRKWETYFDIVWMQKELE